MSTLFATYCSAEKRRDDGLLPAAERYVSARIQDTLEQARDAAVEGGILSGSYGLISPEHGIPWYDHLLKRVEIDGMVPRVVATLGDWDIHEVQWFTASPARDKNVVLYRLVMEKACANLHIPITDVVVETL